MGEASPPDHAFGGIVAEFDPIDHREIFVARRFAEARCADGSGGGGGARNALGRRGMGGGQLVRSLVVLVEQRGPQRNGTAERGQEPRRAIGVIAGARDRRDADQVGGEFLLAGEARQRGVAARLPLFALLLLEDVGDAADELLVLLVLGALGGMAGGDVADLMGHDRGEFRSVVGEGQHAARHIDAAVGQGEGIDDRRVENGDAIGLARFVAGGRKARQDAIQVAFGRRGLVFAAKHLDELPVLGAFRRLHPGGARRLRRQGGHGIGRLAEGVEVGAARQGERQHRRRRNPCEQPKCRPTAPLVVRYAHLPFRNATHSIAGSSDENKAAWPHLPG